MLATEDGSECHGRQPWQRSRGDTSNMRASGYSFEWGRMASYVALDATGSQTTATRASAVKSALAPNVAAGPSADQSHPARRLARKSAAPMRTWKSPNAV